MSQVFDMQGRICEALGVTRQEVEDLDRAMGGPEARAQRAADRQAVLDWAAEVRGRMENLLPADLPEGVKLRWEELDDA